MENEKNFRESVFLRFFSWFIVWKMRCYARLLGDCGNGKSMLSKRLRRQART